MGPRRVVVVSLDVTASSEGWGREGRKERRKRREEGDRQVSRELRENREAADRRTTKSKLTSNIVNPSATSPHVIQPFVPFFVLVGVLCSSDVLELVLLLVLLAIVRVPRSLAPERSSLHRLGRALKVIVLDVFEVLSRGGSVPFADRSVVVREGDGKSRLRSLSFGSEVEVSSSVGGCRSEGSDGVGRGGGDSRSGGVVIVGSAVASVVVSVGSGIEGTCRRFRDSVGSFGGRTSEEVLESLEEEKEATRQFEFFELRDQAALTFSQISCLSFEVAVNFISL